MQVNRRLIIQCFAILLALPILYVVSSGPVIRYASIDLHRTKVIPVPPSSPILRRPRTAQDYFKTAETYRTDSVPFRKDYVQEFYRPLVAAAEALHLGEPLSSYLNLWGVFVMRTKNHCFFLVLNE